MAQAQPTEIFDAHVKVGTIRAKRFATQYQFL